MARHPERPIAFTIVEVLTVVAILSLLLAILLPGLHAARSRAKRIVCSTNLRQLANAWITYLDEHDGYFLKGIDTNWNYGGKQGSGGRSFGLDPTDPSYRIPKPLNRYVNLDEVVMEGAEMFHCPADAGGGDVRASTHYDYKGTSYATNQLLVGQDRMPTRLFDPCYRVIKVINTKLPALRRHQVLNSGKLILIGDGGWLATSDLGNFYRIEWHDRPRSHNLAFMDGHVEFLRVRKGLYVTPEYTLIPFQTLVDDAQACQKEVDDEK